MPGNYTLAADHRCDYTLEIRTGTINRAGTDSVVTIELHDRGSDYWDGVINAIGPKLEIGSLDHVVFRNKHCVDPCEITVSIDGSGEGPDWYCDYVEVRVSRDISRTVLFKIYQWITKDQIANVNLCNGGTTMMEAS